MLVDGAFQFGDETLILGHCIFCPDTLYAFRGKSDTLFPAGSYDLVGEDTDALADTFEANTSATFSDAYCE